MAVTDNVGKMNDWDALHNFRYQPKIIWSTLCPTAEMFIRSFHTTFSVSVQLTAHKWFLLPALSYFKPSVNDKF